MVTLTLERSGEVLNATQLEGLESQLAEGYGVNPDDVVIEATYTVAGSLQLDSLPDDLREDELEEALEQSIADALGVHSKDVDVNVDPETGEVTYTVTTSDDWFGDVIFDNVSSGI